MGVASPPIVPGCMIVWMDPCDAFHIALVVQFTLLKGMSAARDTYVVTIVAGNRIKDVVLYREDVDVRWRVLSGR